MGVLERRWNGGSNEAIENGLTVTKWMRSWEKLRGFEGGNETAWENEDNRDWYIADISLHSSG